MAKAGRNEPCPCGSGKKFKRCCGAVETSASSTTNPALALHAGDQDLVREMLAWLRKSGNQPWLNAATEAYFDGPPPEDLEVQLLVPWSLYCFPVKRRTIAARFLDDRKAKLSEETQAWLKSQSQAWLSIWEVVAVKPEIGLQVRDLLTLEERFVHEVSGSRMLGLRDSVLARIVDHGGISTFCGTHPRPLPPSDANRVVQAVRQLCRVRTRPITVKKLGAIDIQLSLITAWQMAVNELDRPKPMPKLCNTDGDPFLVTKDHFNFKPEERAAVLANLQEVEGAQKAEDDEEEDETEVAFTKPGNSKTKGMDNTLIGRALVSGSRLTLETNSVRRADDLRQRVEAGLGSLVRYGLRDHSDVEALIKERRKPTRDADEERTGGTPPELRGILRDFKEKHMAGWLDDQIPALGGMTPREAAAKPSARVKLDLLLRDMENHESRLPAEERFDFDRLRSELGLA